MMQFLKNTLCCGVAAAAMLLSHVAIAANQPNIIVILTDDQGWMDSSVYGSQFYETPNIDRLAARGVRFTNAYSASPLCSPTRLSVLTGHYPHRHGMTAPHGHLATIPLNTPLYTPGKRSASSQAYQVPESARSLPNDVLTYGKVFKQAGYATAFIGKWHLGKPPYMPENHGFDLVVGGRGEPGPPGGFFAPWRSDTLPKSPEGTHIDDAITDEAIGFMRKNQDQSFLLNLWFYNVHAPFQAKQPLIQKYRQKTDPRGEQACAIMGAMLEIMDHNIGRVMDELDKLGLAEDTIIVFWSDNGGNMYDEVEGITPTNNAPLKEGKGNIYEGGIRVPAIIDWPGVTEPGMVCDTVVSTIDIFPTLLEMTGIQAPADATFDGLGLEGVLRGEALDREAMFFHFPHYVPKPRNISASAVRYGDYKLIRRYDKNGDDPFVFELYNLAEDIGETKNLADDMPDIVSQLDAMIADHLMATGTPVPPANPAYDPTAFNPITGKGTPPKPAEAKTVAGWNTAGGTTLQLDGGHLVITSQGNDPWIATQAVPKANGPVLGRARIKVKSNGTGQMFWRSKAKPGFEGQFVDFDLIHDGEWHEYEVLLPSVGELTGIRIDPARSPGEIRIDWAEIATPDGTTLKRWDF